jgi:hypothetical protein
MLVSLMEIRKSSSCPMDARAMPSGESVEPCTKGEHEQSDRCWNQFDETIWSMLTHLEGKWQFSQIVRKFRHNLPCFGDNQIIIQTIINKSATGQPNSITSLEHHKNDVLRRLPPNIPDLESQITVHDQYNPGIQLVSQARGVQLSLAVLPPSTCRSWLRCYQPSKTCIWETSINQYMEGIYHKCKWVQSKQDKW